MRYQVISAQSLHQLETMVNVELRHDWSVTGGLVCFPTTDKSGHAVIEFAQAMIRPGEAE